MVAARLARRGLQPPADEPGLGLELTAIARPVATMAQQVGAAPKWAPAIIKEAAAGQNPAFSYFRGRSIHPTLPDLDLPMHDEWAAHILVPHDTASKAGDATAHITKQVPSTMLHYKIQTPSVVVPHNTMCNNYYLAATDEGSPITIYTLTNNPGLQPPPRHPRPEWKHLLHITAAPGQRPPQHAPTPSNSTTLHADCRRAPAQHHNALLSRQRGHPKKAQ